MKQMTYGELVNLIETEKHNSSEKSGFLGDGQTKSARLRYWGCAFFIFWKNKKQTAETICLCFEN